MIENKDDTDIPMNAAVQAATAASNVAAKADDDAAPNRKRPKPSSTTVHIAEFNATTGSQPAGQPPASTTPLGQPPASSTPPKMTYASHVSASAPPKVSSAQAAPSSAAPPAQEPSVCLQAMSAGGNMLRTALCAPRALPSDPTTAPPALGILIKSVHYNKKMWRHYALFGCTEIEIVAAKNTSYPDALLPSSHPGRMVCIRSDLLNPKNPIDASFLHVITGEDMQKLKDINILANYLPDGFGKIQHEPTGMYVKIMSSTYKYGPDDRHTHLRPIYNHVEKKHLLIPISNLHIMAKDFPMLEQAVLPEGTHVHFKIGINPSSGNPFAFNLRLVTILPADNCYGSPPEKMQSMVRQQPGGFKVDLHVAPFGISLRSERCPLLRKHVVDKVPKESIAFYISHTNNAMKDPHFVSVGELDRAFRGSTLKCNWNRANLDQIIEMILIIKNNTTFNAHRDEKKHFTLIFTLANQNLQNVVTNTIAESYNTHKYAGHALLHPNVGVLLVLQPTAHSSKGIVAQINAAQILSKAHCSALHSTYTYPPGYSVPYVMDTGRILLGDEEAILGTSHTYLSILKFADTAKDCKLYEKVIDILEHEVDPIKVTNEVIPIQWQPGSLKKEAASHPILSLLADKDFLMQAEVNYPKQANKDRKKKFDDIIRTAYIKPKPGYNQSVLALLTLRKDILVLPDHSLEEDGFLLRSTRPYPEEAFGLIKHPAVKYIQFLSPYALRIIFRAGFNAECIPEMLKLDRTVAHSADNISLAPSAGSPWNEIIANDIHTTLGRTLLPPEERCPNSTYIGGFTGFPTTEYLQYTLFQGAMGASLPVVDSREETGNGGVFVQYLKSSIRPSTLHAKDVTISIYSTHPTTQEMLMHMANVISHLSMGSLFPVTNGLQFLTVQATAVSSDKGSTMCKEALDKLNAKFQASPMEREDQQEVEELQHQAYPEPEEQKEDEFKEHRSRRSERNSAKAGNSNKQQTNTTNTTTTNNQQDRNKKANQFMALANEDVEVFNDPAIVAVATQNDPRKADAGDFDTSQDWRINDYFKKQWEGHKPPEECQKMAKLVVTIWARDFPKYHGKQLGNNFTGKTKLGGLLSTIGRSGIKLTNVYEHLRNCIRHFTGIDALCNKLEDIIQESSTRNNNNQQQPQQQPTTGPPTTTTSSKTTNQPTTRTSNKTISPSTANQTTITSHYNPLSSIVQDLTVSQEEKKSNTQAEEHKVDSVPMSQDEESSSDVEEIPAPSSNLPGDPSTGIDPASSAAVNYSLNGGTGGMPSIVLALPAPAVGDGNTGN